MSWSFLKLDNGDMVFQYIIILFSFFMLEIFLNKANKGKKKKEKKGNLHLQRKPMLIYIMVSHYKTLCVLTTRAFSHLNRVEDKIK